MPNPSATVAGTKQEKNKKEDKSLREVVDDIIDSDEDHEVGNIRAISEEFSNLNFEDDYVSNVILPSQIRDDQGNLVEYSSSNYATGRKFLIPLDGKIFSKNNSYYLAEKFDKIERYKNFLKISDGHSGFTFVANNKRSEEIEEKYEKVKAVSLKIIKTIPVFGKAIGTVLEFMGNFSDNLLKSLPENIKKSGAVKALSRIPGTDKLLDKFKDVADNKKDDIIAKIFEVININVLDQIKTWNGVKTEECMLDEIVKNINNGPIKAYNETIGTSKNKVIPNIMSPKQMEEKFTVGYQKTMGEYFGIGDYKQAEPKAQVLYKPKWGFISKLFNKFNTNMREIVDKKGGAKVKELGYNNIANEEYLVGKFIDEKKQDAKVLEEDKRRSPLMVIAEIFNKIFRLEKSVKKVSKKTDQKIEAQNEKIEAQDKQIKTQGKQIKTQGKQMEEFKTREEILNRQVEENTKRIELLENMLVERINEYNKNVEETKDKEKEIEEIKELKQRDEGIKKKENKKEEIEESKRQNKDVKEPEKEEETEIKIVRVQKKEITSRAGTEKQQEKRYNCNLIRLRVARANNDVTIDQTQNKSQDQGRGGGNG